MNKEGSYIQTTDNQNLERRSRDLFKTKLPIEWISRDIEPDFGLDLEVQIVEGKRVTNKEFKVQLKATNVNHDHFPVPFQIKTRYLKHYEYCRLPVFIIYYLNPHDTFYCISAQRYIREIIQKENPEWREQESVTIKFDEDSEIKDFAVLDHISEDIYFSIILNNPQPKPDDGAIYWLDGIPQSENKELKKRNLDAHLYISANKLEDAIEVYEGILRELFLAPIEKMSVLLNLGSTYYLIRQIEKAMKNFESTLEIAKKIDDISAKVGEAYALNSIGLIYQRIENWEESLSYFEKSLKLHNEAGNKRGEAYVLGNIALTYKEKSKKISEHDKLLKNAELDKALRYAKSMLEIFKEVGYKLGEALALIDIGVIYSTKEEWDEALKNYNQSLEMQREMNNKLGEALILGNIGADYYSKGELVDAMKYCEDSLRIYQEIGSKQGIAYQIGKIGLIFEAKKEFKLAKEYLIAAINILNEIGLKYGRDVFERALKEIEGKA